KVVFLFNVVDARIDARSGCSKLACRQPGLVFYPACRASGLTPRASSGRLRVSIPVLTPTYQILQPKFTLAHFYFLRAFVSSWLNILSRV
ncbi:MAG: hypothetical protein ACE5NM_05150, partial [Sedimentisphaerales bacterium]